ncbi:Fis family transcriptional regulator [Sphingobium indicum IP26]|uniref:very short patch repair endonuclease n=1 Tax=Sphingobium indicum TaxID=332055 RepID=UPI0003766381|nr:very short patch repair endonuclease [Sphingobium indicum]EPR17531.1 Fis family transcriptional regulator [Sphingobium indicum IP26]
MALSRSETMARVPSKNTTPEMRVRRVLHARGLRYRLHARDLPGRPDLVFRKAKVAVFVHGCFWHSHPGCSRARIPSSRQDYWIPKLERNVKRDAQVQVELIDAGWTVVVVWECETKCIDDLADWIQRAVSDRSSGGSD